jgi:hypothetical protein
MEKKKLSPANCKDQYTANQLNEQGIMINEDSLTVEPAVVVLRLGSCTLRIPQRKFEIFAKWYLEEQELKPKSTKQLYKGIYKDGDSF